MCTVESGFWEASVTFTYIYIPIFKFDISLVYIYIIIRYLFAQIYTFPIYHKMKNNCRGKMIISGFDIHTSQRV